MIMRKLEVPHVRAASINCCSLRLSAKERTNRMRGGQLTRAKTAVVNEIQIARFDGIHLNRRLNERTGLRELVFD